MSEQTANLERFQGYLLILAELHMGRKLREKLDPSDIVQQTLVDAYQDRAQFHGTNEMQLRAWLRQVLANNIRQAGRAFHRAKRDTDRERSLQQAMDASSQRFDAWLAADYTSPSGKAQRQEDVDRIVEALAQLPAAQREAMLMRHCQGKPLAEISRHLGKTTDAVAGLLKRGASQIRELLARRE